MNFIRIISKSTALACVFAVAPLTSHAADSASLEIASGDKTKMARLSLQWNWETQWWRSNGTHIGGYWQLSLSQWRESHFQGIAGSTQNISAVGITPVFRLQNDNLRGFYAEAGIGAHVLSDLYDNDGKQLSTRFQFGDHVGVGYVFQNRLDIGVSVQHFSNGGFKKPNDGVNFAIIRLSYPL